MDIWEASIRTRADGLTETSIRPIAPPPPTLTMTEDRIQIAMEKGYVRGKSGNWKHWKAPLDGWLTEDEMAREVDTWI